MKINMSSYGHISKLMSKDDIDHYIYLIKTYGVENDDTIRSILIKIYLKGCSDSCEWMSKDEVVAKLSGDPEFEL